MSIGAAIILIIFFIWLFSDEECSCQSKPKRLDDGYGP